MGLLERLQQEKDEEIKKGKLSGSPQKKEEHKGDPNHELK